MVQNSLSDQDDVAQCKKLVTSDQLLGYLYNKYKPDNGTAEVEDTERQKGSNVDAEHFQDINYTGHHIF